MVSARIFQEGLNGRCHLTGRVSSGDGQHKAFEPLLICRLGVDGLLEDDGVVSVVLNLRLNLVLEVLHILVTLVLLHNVVGERHCR
jgi:hypothetical protein